MNEPTIVRKIEIRFDQNMVQAALMNYIREKLRIEEDLMDIQWINQNPWNYIVIAETPDEPTTIKK